MAPGFVSTLFSSSRNGDQSLSLSTPTSTTNSPPPQSSTNSSTRATLTSFRTKFRASVTPSSLASTHKTTTTTPFYDDSDQQNTTPGDVNGIGRQKTLLLSASVPASSSSSSHSSSNRYSMRSSTPLWGAVGTKLTKKPNSKTNLDASSSISRLPSSSSPSRQGDSSGLRNKQEDEQGDSVPTEEEGSNKGTITRNTLRRTLSRLSLNTSTLNGRQARERMFTSSSYRSTSSSSPRLGSTANNYSPRIAPYFRLPRLQNFSPHLRMDTAEIEVDDGIAIEYEDEGKNSWKASKDFLPLPLNFKVVTSRYHQYHQNDLNVVEDNRYTELANLISILEQSPRSPRGSTPSTPALSSKKSSFSLKRSTRSKVIPTTVGRSSSRQASPSSTNSGTKAKDLPIATSARELSKVRNERLLQALEPLEVRSYSFPAPSIPPPLPEQARLKPSKSLNDLLSAKDTSSRATSRRVSIVSSSSTSGKTCVSYSEESMIESCYPALCTPPRTPRSRHASIEWFVDFRAVDEDGKLGYVEVQEVACDESTLMPDILGPPIELLLQKEEVQSSIGEGLDVTEEERSHNRSSEVYDSLMELIESFPSPTVISTSTFTTPSSPASSSGISPSNVSSPSNSLWSFQHTNTASTSTYSPTSTMAVVTPVSEIPRDKLVPESGYFTSQRGGDGEDETVGHKEGYTIEDEEGRMNLKDENLQGRVSRNVLASHRALTDVLDL